MINTLEHLLYNTLIYLVGSLVISINMEAYDIRIISTMNLNKRTRSSKTEWLSVAVTKKGALDFEKLSNIAFL